MVTELLRGPGSCLREASLAWDEHVVRDAVVQDRCEAGDGSSEDGAGAAVVGGAGAGAGDDAGGRLRDCSEGKGTGAEVAEVVLRVRHSMADGWVDRKQRICSHRKDDSDEDKAEPSVMQQNDAHVAVRFSKEHLHVMMNEREVACSDKLEDWRSHNQDRYDLAANPKVASAQADGRVGRCVDLFSWLCHAVRLRFYRHVGRSRSDADA